jgi:multidrug resistance efflux pump
MPRARYIFEAVAPLLSFRSGTLPPENATGNFTKIVQRVPVKILLERESTRGYEQRLVPGLSVETDVTLSPVSEFAADHSNAIANTSSK